MSLFNVFHIASSAMSAQSQRLNVVASNIANAESTDSANGKAYRARQVELMATDLGKSGGAGVKVARVIEGSDAGRQVYNPAHPKADEKGYVTMPNVNVVEEMVNMLSASKAYQTNVDTLNAAKSMLNHTLTIGQ